MTTTTPRNHLSCHRDVTDPDRPVVYTVLSQGMPLCAPTTRENALAVWRRHFGATPAALWLGDRGEWYAGTIDPKGDA